MKMIDTAVVALAGRRIDLPEAQVPRFPLENVQEVGQRISEVFYKMHGSKETARQPPERSTIGDVRWAAIAKFSDIGLRTGDPAVEVDRVLPLILLLGRNSYLDSFRCVQRPGLTPHRYDPVSVLVTVACREITPEKSLDRVVLGRNQAFFYRHIGKHFERLQPWLSLESTIYRQIVCLDCR